MTLNGKESGEKMMKVWLERIHPDGKAAQFVGSAANGVLASTSRSRTESKTFFLELHGEALKDDEQLQAGELFAVCVESDAEPGDLVVWWTGSAATLALAKMGEDLRLYAVGGFPAPQVDFGCGESSDLHGAALCGVVVGRLRRMRPAS